MVTVLVQPGYMTSGYGAFHCNCFNLFKKAFQKDFCTVAV